MKAFRALVRLLAVSAAACVPWETTPHPSPVRNEALARAEMEFARGVELRSDATKAWPAFARAAAAYDELWAKRYFAPALALDRARAHRLAGDMPGSILSLHAGLTTTPYDRDLQTALAEARSAVAYPALGNLETQCRPRPVLSIGSWMSAAEAALITGWLWLMTCLAVTRYFMSRAAGWLVCGGIGVVGLIAFGGLWWHDGQVHTRNEAHPLAVVAEDVVLRTGNATSYPPRLEARLPRGVELRVLGERGGWYHVELSGGAAGWVPATTLIR